jgi:hypothetical protein
MKALLFRQKNQAVSQPQDDKGRAGPKTLAIPELLGNRQLAFLPDFGGCQILQKHLLVTHDRRLGMNILPRTSTGVFF